MEQIIETPAISLAGKIVEMLVQTQEKTRQVTNPQVQHVVNTVEAEMPKIVKETVQRKWPVINEKINQVTKHPEVHLTGVMKPDDPDAEVPQVQVSEKKVGIPQLECIDKVVDVLVVLVAQVPHVQVVAETVEISQLQAVEKIVETSETQTIQGARTSERSGTAPVRHRRESRRCTPQAW